MVSGKLFQKCILFKTPLNSYNLEVNTDHTFFVKGIGGLDGVWVHNKDCWYIIPSEATTQTKKWSENLYV